MVNRFGRERKIDVVDHLREYDKEKLNPKIMEELPKRKTDRVIGEKYLYKGEVRIWGGHTLFCEHGRVKGKCRECGGSQYCEHGRRRQNCKECGGSSICEHGSHRQSCYDCSGCEHGKLKSMCLECGGGAVCEHGRVKGKCREVRWEPVLRTRKKKRNLYYLRSK